MAVMRRPGPWCRPLGFFSPVAELASAAAFVVLLAPHPVLLPLTRQREEQGWWMGTTIAMPPLTLSLRLPISGVTAASPPPPPARLHAIPRRRRNNGGRRCWLNPGVARMRGRGRRSMGCTFG